MVSGTVSRLGLLFPLQMNRRPTQSITTLELVRQLSMPDLIGVSTFLSGHETRLNFDSRRHGADDLPPLELSQRIQRMDKERRQKVYVTFILDSTLTRL